MAELQKPKQGHPTRSGTYRGSVVLTQAEEVEGRQPWGPLKATWGLQRLLKSFRQRGSIQSDLHFSKITQIRAWRAAQRRQRREQGEAAGRRTIPSKRCWGPRRHGWTVALSSRRNRENFVIGCGGEGMQEHFQVSGLGSWVGSSRAPHTLFPVHLQSLRNTCRLNH